MKVSYASPYHLHWSMGYTVTSRGAPCFRTPPSCPSPSPLPLPLPSHTHTYTSTTQAYGRIWFWHQWGNDVCFTWSVRDKDHVSELRIKDRSERDLRSVCFVNRRTVFYKRWRHSRESGSPAHQLLLPADRRVFLCLSYQESENKQIHYCLISYHSFSEWKMNPA